MKKLIALLLTLAFLLSAASCLGSEPEETTHTHAFVISETESTDASCLEAGVKVEICVCGERKETPIEATGHTYLSVVTEPTCLLAGHTTYLCACGDTYDADEVEALGHDLNVTMEIAPSCTRPGSIDYKCARCFKKQYTTVEPLGHNYEEAPSEPSRVIRCNNEGCTSCLWAESNGKHTEALTFSFTKEDEAAIDAKYDEVLALINAAAKYDPALHAYATEGALADEYAIVDAIHTELYELIENAIAQRQLAEIAYYCDMDNTELEETYSYMMDYYTAVIAKFYTLSRPFYDSCYREFYYYGMSDEEINAFLFDSDTLSNPEYTALKNRNDEIEVEFLALTNPQTSEIFPALYAEFAENNNKMAALMGYENHLEYAYENVYGRDYTYQDVTELSSYVKTYIAPIFNTVYNQYRGYSSSANQTDRDHYQNQLSHSFFSNYYGNLYLNDYIDLMAFTSNPDKTISFSDEFNKLMGDGNMFRGDYKGAFVTSIYSVDLPIAYFGPGYDNAFTVVHEFGHFMNEIYSGGEYDQSYDLLEMHSQGNELLYLCYLQENGDFTEVGEALIRTESLVNMLYVIMAGMTVDTFEQAVYLNKYEGKNAEVIMADGTITSDEYDLLYTSICSDYGVEEVLRGYWRYGMTITSPCYYVSYSMSALSVLQLYEIANTEGFDVAKDAYLKLFTYVDENPDMSMEEILTYAGMLSFKDEELYVRLNEYMLK